MRLLIGTNPALGPNGETERRVPGQRYDPVRGRTSSIPSVALDAVGDAAVVWSGYGHDAAGNPSQSLVFYQRYTVPTDTAGPLVTDLQGYQTNDALVPLPNDTFLDTYSITQLVVSFDEPMSAQTVTNTANWTITMGGSSFYSKVAKVQYGLNEAYNLGPESTPTGQYQAVVTVDGNPFQTGNQALYNGTYTLDLSDAVTDVYGNQLDGLYTGTAGSGDYSSAFTIDVTNQPAHSAGRRHRPAIDATASHSVATDNSGNFVDVWTTTDQPVLLPDGSDGLDAAGNPVTGTNVYAQYNTNPVQQITLAAGTSKFSLIYGGNTVEELSFSQATPTLDNVDSPLQGTFQLWIDVNGNGKQDPGEITAPIDFYEAAYDSGNPTFDPALVIQAALRKLGGALGNVTVTATDADTYMINFGSDANLQTQPQLVVVNPQWQSGFLPSAQVSIVSQPTIVGATTAGAANINVSPTDPALTAEAIEQAFAAITTTSIVPAYTQADMPTDLGPLTQTTDIPVTVTPAQTAADPNGLLTFNITFTSSYADLPILVPSQVVNSAGTALTGTTVVVTKESSQPFRVNPHRALQPVRDPARQLPTPPRWRWTPTAIS